MTNNNYSEIELECFKNIAEHAVANAVEKEKIKSKRAMKISVKKSPKSMVRMTDNNFSEIELKYFRYIAEHAVANAVEKEKKDSMYAGFIYYYKVTFKKTVTLENGRVIKGFHIMPYRINAEDMEKAEKSCQDRRFNEIINSDSSFVNYDEGSGNFHKVPDGEFQVVLLDENANPDGPGPNTYENRSKNKDMYFPRPDSKNVHKGNDLEQFIKDAMDYLKENEKKE